MEREETGKDFESESLDLHKEDEQASSNEEGFPFDQNGYPTGARHSSMYSRIHQDVQTRIPNIDFDSVEVDENEESQFLEGVLSSDENVEGVSRIAALEIYHPPDYSVNGIADDNGDQANEASCDDLCLASNDADNLHLNQMNFSKNASKYPLTNGTTDVCNDDQGDTDDLTNGTGFLNCSKSECRSNTSTVNGENGSDVDDKKKFESLEIMLANNIDERNLDEVLHALDSSSISRGFRNQKASETAPTSSSTDSGENDLPLLHRLSSFAITEKNSISEANILLEQLSNHPSAGVTKERPSSIFTESTMYGTDTGRSAKKDRGEMRIGTRMDNTTEGNETVFIDLRSSVQSCDGAKEASKALQDESSSGSEGEEWMDVRRSIKARLNMRSCVKPGNIPNSCSYDEIHERISQRSYERLVMSRGDDVIVGNVGSVVDGGAKRISRGVNEIGFTRNVKSSFDLEPLEEKIRSWHQIRDNNQNWAGNVESGGDFDKKGSLCGGKRTTDVSAAPPNKTVYDEVVEMSGEEGNFWKESGKCRRRVLEDSSLLQLEDTNIKSDISKSTRKSLLIVDEKNSTSELLSLQNDAQRTDETHVNCCIETLTDNVRISDNLMLIKANISADAPDLHESEKLPLLDSDDLEDKGGAERNPSVVDDVKHGDCVSSTTEQEASSSDLRRKAIGRILSLDEVEKGLLIDPVVGGTEQQYGKERESNFEMEMKTFAIAEERNCSFVSDGEEMVELSSTLKGLLPQYGRQMFNKYLDSKGGMMQGCKVVDKSDMLSNHHQSISSGEETQRITRQSSESQQISEVDDDAVKGRANETSSIEAERKDAPEWKQKTGGGERAAERVVGSGKSKKKSKKKNRKSSENAEEKQTNDGKKNVNCETDLVVKLSKKVSNIESETKKKSVCLVKENERVQIEEKIKALQEDHCIKNIIFDEKVSYTHPFKSLPTACKDATKLMLKVHLEAPGICSKSCAKNTLSLDERSDAFIGLCTLFVSLLHGSRFKVCEMLSIPFDVIALEQATIDSQLQLVIGIIENEVQMQQAQPLKRGKPTKVKKSFFQIVTQYLNKTDLEAVLSDVMDFDLAHRDFTSTVVCPGAKKLSSYVTVSQDETAVARIFSLKPSMVWSRSEDTESQMNDDVFWMKGKQKNNENTCVVVEHITSMLPRTIGAFMKTPRSNSLDICGLRIAYITNKDNSEETTLVAAFRGPTVTTAQDGKSFTTDTQELASVKSVFMPRGLDPPCDDVRDAVISVPNSIKTFIASIADPLITYTIGRGRGEREVVNWFGRRTLSLSDVDLTDSDVKSASKPDELSRQTASASLLTIARNRIVLSMSHLVPSVFISIAMAIGESRGLHAVTAGKCVLNEEDAMALGLRREDCGGNGVRDHGSKRSKTVSVLVFEGENSAYRAYGFVRHLFKKLNGKLPRDALTKDAVRETLNGLIKYEPIKQERSIEEFFGLVQLSKRVAKIIEKVTAKSLSNLDKEVIGALPSNWKLFLFPEVPRVSTAIFVGKPMLEIFPFILHELFKECLEDPFCVNTNASTERTFRQQERPVGELIGLKCYTNLSKQIAHVLSPFVVGAKPWTNSVDNLRKGPVIVVVFRLLDSIKYMEEKCNRICRHVCKLLNSKELHCPPDSYYDAFTYTDLDTVFRVMLNMFKVDELMPDACPTWFSSTQWPLYLSDNNAIVRRIDPILGLLSNTHQLKPFRSDTESAKYSTHSSRVRILSPLTMSIPAELILGKQASLTFIELFVDCNFSKYIPKILGILRRDSFDVVGLNFPSGYSPSFETTPTMHVALRRPDAVFRLNQWLPGLTEELHNKHTIRVSRGAKEAFDAIVRNFQKTGSGGIFDDSNLSVTENLVFQNDDIYDCKDFRRVEWTGDPNSKLTSSSDSRIRATTDSNRGFVMPEINVIIITNVMMRGAFLDQYISENAKFLGFWEHISSLGFKTIGSRMTSLSLEQVDSLLEKLKLPAKQHGIMQKRLAFSNGPIVALALLKDFALSNFWQTITKSLNENECKIVSENVLVPSTKTQVEILLASLFETIVPNSEVEIKRIGKLKR